MNRLVKFLLTCIFFFTSLIAEDDFLDISQLEVSLSADCEPLTTVADCVNVQTGNFFQIDPDLICNSIDPLPVIRYYDSGNKNQTFMGYGFGSQFPLSASEMQDASRHSYALISERDGVFIPYRGKLHSDHTDKRKTCTIDPRVIEKGYTNLSSAEISGSSNLINRRATLRPEEKKWTVHKGDQSVRIYGKPVKLGKYVSRGMGLPTKESYFLTEEIKPNGNRLLYSYINRRGVPFLAKVQTRSRIGNALINELNLSYEPYRCKVTSSCGNELLYSLKPGICGPTMLLRVDSTQKDTQYYGNHINIDELHPRITRTTSRDRVLTVDYDLQGRVKRLLEPLGTDNQLMTTYAFHYFDNLTMVINPLKLQTNYAFENHRVARIDYRFNTPENFNIFGKYVLRQEFFDWNDLGWLQSKGVGIGEMLLHLRTFKYDSNGNILSETIYGNLTGKNFDFFPREKRKHMDSFTICYQYTDDGRNLVSEKTTSAGLIVKYAYLPDTNLKTKELHIYDGKIQERLFRKFDGNGQVSLIIQDDGSSGEKADLSDVTYRLIKKIVAVQEQNIPSFGKPHKIIEMKSDLQTGESQPIKTTEFEYDRNGNEIKQRVYDSQNEFLYQIIKTYDERQRVRKIRDPIGRVTIYRYDNHNNIIYEALKGSGKETQYEYDHVNNLIAKKEIHADGEEFTTRYAYNAMHQVVSEIDAYGHATNYAYDHLGSEIECSKPADQNGIRPSCKKKYNILNQVSVSTNENGETTFYKYNICGKPVKITYPDGAVEQYIYRKSGPLKQKINADGTSIAFKHDAKGRVLNEIYRDKEGNLIKEVSYRYKGALLQSKTDGMGLVTTYNYDGAGRKIRETVGDGLKIVNYVYDDFDRVIRIERLINEDAQIECYTYDHLDRVLSKTLQDAQGTIFARETYAYDIQGNRTEKKIDRTNNETVCYRYVYNSDGTLHSKENPLGYQTRHLYNHRHYNGLNQRVQCRAIFDALGRPVREADDVYGRIVCKEIYEGDRPLSRSQYRYDLSGNLTSRHEQVMVNGKLKHEYTVEMNSDSRGRLISEIEKPEGKSTLFEYDLAGRMSKKIKPDGVVISYEYDGLGRLEKMKSSDKSISYIYKYDLHDNPIVIRDLVNKTVHKRKYNLLDQPEEEEIDGIRLTYRYDSLDRLIEMTLPDGSSVKYERDAYHLRKIRRFNPQGELKYEQESTAYDLFGNLLESRTPAGKTNYGYDQLGRTVSIQSGTWESHLEEFDAVGNLLAMTQKDPTGEFRSLFTYDRFDHLNAENSLQENKYRYDSIGNCVQKNGLKIEVNRLNQVTDNGNSQFTYDKNGNLITQTNPPVIYRYDALNRLVSVKDEQSETLFSYDSFGRCIKIQENGKDKRLLYLKNKEIGALSEGKLEEFRLLDPSETSEAVYALEIGEEAYFPIQDARYNIAALKKADGKIAEWYRHSAFGQELQFPINSLNPWRFANRRQIAGLIQYQHRYYHPSLMRWLTTDPVGFEEGMNLYTYVKNNPLYYSDPDGRFVHLLFTIPLLVWGGSAGVVFTAAECATLSYLGAAAAGSLLGYGAYQLGKRYEVNCDLSKLGEIKNTVSKLYEIKCKLSRVYDINCKIKGYLQEYWSDEPMHNGSLDTSSESQANESLTGQENEISPPYSGESLGNDSTKCPGDGFEWRGKGEPSTGRGRWVNETKEESLHPDFKHPPPKKPHWDYVGPNFPKGARLNLDGTWEPKL